MNPATTLPKIHLAILEAMTLPDPQPRVTLDSPGAAIQRRLPGVLVHHVTEIMRDLNALGLTNVPYIDSMVHADATADLTQWITDEGWEALGGRRRGEPKL